MKQIILKNSNECFWKSKELDREPIQPGDYHCGKRTLDLSKVQCVHLCLHPYGAGYCRDDNTFPEDCPLEDYIEEDK